MVTQRGFSIMLRKLWQAIPDLSSGSMPGIQKQTRDQGSAFATAVGYWSAKQRMDLREASRSEGTEPVGIAEQ